MAQVFDPDAAAQPGSGIFGLSCTREQSRIVLTPVPFDATTSYGKGTAEGPGAILEASAQVDLYDVRFGRVYERGVFLEAEKKKIRKLNVDATELGKPIIKAGGASTKKLQAAAAKVNAICESVNAIVQEETSKVLAEGRVPGLVGGEHAMSFGAIAACTEALGEIGIFQIDAHMDLRDAFEGFEWSHASIMHNVMSKLPKVVKLVQVGIRDFGEGEVKFAAAQGRRVVSHLDDQWSSRLNDGARFSELCRGAVEALPEKVYVSFDIDGLDPSLCPHTGTPVPGGLSFNQAVHLLDTLRASGRKVIGFDLVEVAPGGKNEWDANVGARILYKLCGIASI